MASCHSQYLLPDSVLWTLSCFVINVDYDNIYMVSSLILWMLIDYFVYRHESVIEELSDIEIVPLEQNEVDVSGMAAEVQRLFEEDKIYLNPKLKLSDVALAVGTNRTYLSRYFNRQNGQTFYDYVNTYRIQYAENLLKSTNYPCRKSPSNRDLILFLRSEEYFCLFWLLS